MRLSPLRSAAVLAAFAGLALTASCGSDNNALAPQFQPEVSNQTDTFQFQATGVDGVTQTLSYTWSNTGTAANIDQSCSLTQGSATLTLRDPSGTVVYTRNLADGGSFQTSSGTAGNWRILVVLDGAHGTMNFRAQKRT